jgi:S-adenosylmethionine:tRNA ribosyltransferase-isomerase
MRASVFDYELPSERIAQWPADEREAARLMLLRSGAPEHRTVADLPELVTPGALVIVNDTRVLPARLLGHKAVSGGRVEILLVRRVAGAAGELEVWRALGRASKGLRVGTVLDFGEIEAHVLGREDDEGLFEIGLRTRDGGPVGPALQRVGHVPLPPYIRREDGPSDRDRYQTVYARVDGAVAAPTAGLHLTDALLDRLRKRGVEIASVTLHVGYGTFKPVTTLDLDDHEMHAEEHVVPQATSAAIARARERNAPVIAVGTTVVRALESTADPGRDGYVRPTAGETRLLIQPGYRFRVVDELLTNFHLPRSTLLALVSAFAGIEAIRAAYASALREGYRFFSYGDAMLVARSPS